MTKHLLQCFCDVDQGRGVGPKAGTSLASEAARAYKGVLWA